MSDLVSISPGNTKTGRIPAISLRPVADCGNCRHCARDCYALKAWQQYPVTREAWGRNSELARTARDSYFDQVGAYLERKHPEYFRWHIAGDILDQDYFNRMARVARANPETRFLVFTKMHSLNYRRRPDNLTVVLSMWPGAPRGRARLPRAWVQDGFEARVPDTAISCPGNCETCGMCWQLPKLQRDVVFKIH